MSYLKLVKLLYLADRRALLELGKPISYDLYVSMPHGPVLSRTLDLITSEPDDTEASYWRKHISERRNYEVHLLGEAPNDQLSPAYETILDAVFREYGHLGKYEIRDLSHTLPEWQDPHGSALPIEIKDVLLYQGVSEEDADAIIEELMAETIAQRILA
jgi:hypothetical protein